MLPEGALHGPLLNAGSMKGVGQSVDPRIKLSVGQFFGAMHHREVFWKGACRLCQELTDIYGFSLPLLSQRGDEGTQLGIEALRVLPKRRMTDTRIE